MVKFIAEAGVNHNGSLDIGYELIEKAALAGADIIKFQTFKTNSLVTKNTKLSEYQVKNVNNINSQYDLLKSLELPYASFRKLADYAKKTKIEFLSTAFDEFSLQFLINDIGVNKLKISSGDLTNAPFLLMHAQSGLDIILSTGMAKLADVEAALGVIACGYLNNRKFGFTLNDFDAAYRSIEGQKILHQKVTLLHCTTEYPAETSSINLRNIITLRDSFHLKTGFSDHSEGITIPIAAASLGINIIEKHFTLNKLMPGPDHMASIEPKELTELIVSIRKVIEAMGSPIKFIQETEIKHLDKARKTIVAINDIPFGGIFSVNNISTMRAPYKMSPFEVYNLYGENSKHAYKSGDVIDE